MEAFIFSGVWNFKDICSHNGVTAPGDIPWSLFIIEPFCRLKPLTVTIQKRDERDRGATNLARQMSEIVEGLFSLYWPQLRELLDLKVYVETPDEECYARRLRRDVAERGRTPESILHQYNVTVRPMAEAYVRPTAQYADITVSGVVPLDSSIRTVLNAIETRRQL